MNTTAPTANRYAPIWTAHDIEPSSTGKRPRLSLWPNSAEDEPGTVCVTAFDSDRDAHVSVRLSVEQLEAMLTVARNIPIVHRD